MMTKDEKQAIKIIHMQFVSLDIFAKNLAHQIEKKDAILIDALKYIQVLEDYNDKRNGDTSLKRVTTRRE